MVNILVSDFIVDQFPGQYKVKLKFIAPTVIFTSLKILRMNNKYASSADDERATLISTIEYEEDMLGKEITVIDDTVSPNNVYYYTIYTITDDKVYSSTKTQRNICIPELAGFEQKLLEIQPDEFIKSDETGDYRKLLIVIARFLEYIHSKTKALEILFDTEKMTPDIIYNVAKEMGWEIDTRLPLDIQRALIPNITFFYKWSDTSSGLNRLVKFYSGYPDNSGVIEGSNRLLFTPRFISGQITFLDKRLPDFGEDGDDFSKVGTSEDPLYYCYDFSDASRFNLSRTFTVYFQRPPEMTDYELNKIISILRAMLDKHSPLGVDYDILIY